MLKRVCAAIAFVLLGSALVPTASEAATFDPKLSFKTIETDHFRIHFPEGLKTSAERLGVMAEQVHVALSPKLDWAPKRRTEVVLVDTTDDSNGITTVIPYNDILLFLSPPRADSSLFNYDDYLAMLFIHEYTHVLHIDAYGGITTPFRWIAGKIIVPNGATPGWVREGWAVYQESDETGYGRANSSYTDMVIRTDLLDGRFLPMDRADGVGKRWPAASTQYLYGGAFWKWLVKTYGVDAVNQFHQVNRDSMWFFAVDARAWKVFGKHWETIWKEWETSLVRDLEALKSKMSAPTPSEPFVTDKQASYLTWAKNGDYALYLQSLDVGSYIWTQHAGSPTAPSKATPRQKLKRRAPDKALRGMDLSGQLSLAADGSKLAYSALQRGTYGSWSRIFVYDPKSRKSKALSTADKKPLRGFDPDWSPDGKRLVYTCHDAEAEGLCLYDATTKEVSPLFPKNSDTQYLNPRFSPDGKHVAVIALKQGRFALTVADIAAPSSSKAVALLEAPFHILYPTWNPDGRSIVYSSDETGIYNLYEISLNAKTRKRLTDTLTGFFQPTYSPDGTLYAQVYTEKGFEIHVISKPSDEDVKMHPITAKISSAEARVAPGGELPMKAYTPFTPSLFVPRYLLPLWLLTDNDAIFGFATGSNDPLYRHLWSANATYRTGPSFIGFGGDYVYNRYKPIIAASFSRYSVDFGDVFGVGDNFYEERWHGALGTAYTWKRNTFRTHYFFEERDAYNQKNQNIAALNLGHYAGFHFGYAFGNAKRYPASISAEKGFSTSLGFDVSDAALGSEDKNEQRVFTGDMRYFYELPWLSHHVLALRGTGGITFGDRFVQRTFALGGSLGEGPLAQTSRRTFSLRGVPFADFGGERALVFSAEYRVPLFTAERGFGNWPLFLNRAHLGLFADYGDIFNADSGRDGDDFFDRFMLGVGAELRGDFVFGHGLPITGRLGYGIVVTNRDRLNGSTDDTTGGDAKSGTVVLQLGTSF